MSSIFEAVFENGAFKPTAPVSGISEGQRVHVKVTPLGGVEPVSESEREAEFLRRLEEQGLLDNSILTHDERMTPDWKPIDAPGPLLSEIIIEDRR